MTRCDNHDRFRHMFDHPKEALQMLRGQTRSDSNEDCHPNLNLTLVGLFEMGNGTAGNVSAEKRSQCQAIPWSEIVVFHNRRTHKYHEINLDIVWQIASVDLQALGDVLGRGLSSEGSAREL